MLELRQDAWLQAVSTEQQQQIAGALVDALTDKDTGVSCDAAAALQTYGSNEQGVLGLQSYAVSLHLQHQNAHAGLMPASLPCAQDCIQ